MIGAYKVRGRFWCVPCYERSGRGRYEGKPVLADEDCLRGKKCARCDRSPIVVQK